MNLLTIFFVFIFISIFSCSTPRVNFQSGSDVLITAQKLGEFTDKGESVKVNAPVDASTLNGKMIRINVKDKPSYFWVFYQPSFGDVTVRVDAPEIFSALTEKKDSPEGAAKTNPNLIPRLSFMSSQALDQKDYKAAEQLADQLATLDRQLSLPYVIKALAAAGQGKTKEAKTLLKQAKSIDPSDTEIDKLINEI